MDAALVERLNAARRFGAGMQYARQHLYASFDMALYGEQPRPALETWKQMEEATPLGYVPGTNFPATFAHIAGGYAAGYYGYMWAEVIALDMLSAFGANLMNPEVGMRFRREILSRGGEEPAARAGRAVPRAPGEQRGVLEGDHRAAVTRGVAAGGSRRTGQRPAGRTPSAAIHPWNSSTSRPGLHRGILRRASASPPPRSRRTRRCRPARRHRRTGPAATSLPDRGHLADVRHVPLLQRRHGGRLLGRPLRPAAQERELIRVHRRRCAPGSPASLARSRRRCPSVPTTGAPRRRGGPPGLRGRPLRSRAHDRASPAVMSRMPRRSPSSVTGPAPTSVFSRHRRSRLRDVPRLEIGVGSLVAR